MANRHIGSSFESFVKEELKAEVFRGLKCPKHNPLTLFKNAQKCNTCRYVYMQKLIRIDEIEWTDDYALITKGKEKFMLEIYGKIGNQEDQMECSTPS